MVKPNPGETHGPKCQRQKYAIGLDMEHCIHCRILANQEIVEARYRRAGMPEPEVSS